MKFTFNNIQFDLSKIKVGTKTENEFLKKYAGENSVFELEELEALKRDLKPYVEDGILSKEESISWFSKIMNISQTVVENMFSVNNKNYVEESLNELFYEEFAKQTAIKTNCEEIQTALELYHQGKGGAVSKFYNSIKEIFNTEYAGDRVYRQLIKAKVSADMVALAENNELQGEKYVRLKIDLLESFLGADSFSPNEKKSMQDGIKNITIPELNDYIEKLANAEDSEYNSVQNEILKELKLKANQKNNDIGFSVRQYNTVDNFLNSSLAEKKMDFSKTFQYENGVEFNPDNISDYLAEQSNFNRIAGINNIIAKQYNNLDEKIKTKDLKSIKEEILNVLNAFYGENTDEKLDFLNKNKVENLDNLTLEELTKVAKNLQDVLQKQLDKLLEGKSIEDYAKSLCEAKNKAFGVKNNVKLAEKFSESQANGIGYVKMGVGGLGFIATLCGGPIALVGIGIAFAGGSSVSFIEEASKGEISEETKKEILNELKTDAALNIAGMGIGKISTILAGQVAKSCPKLIAAITEYGSDAVMSVISTAMITGEVDLTGECISQLINVATGIAFGSGKRIFGKNKKINTPNSDVSSKKLSPELVIEIKMKNIPETHPNRKLLEDISLHTNRSSSEIDLLSDLMLKYPNLANDISLLSRNNNIKLLNKDEHIEKILATIKNNPEYHKEITDFMSIQRKADSDTTNPLEPLEEYLKVLKEMPERKNEIIMFSKNTNIDPFDYRALINKIDENPDLKADILFFVKNNYSIGMINRQLNLINKYPSLRKILCEENPQYSLIDKEPASTSKNILEKRFNIKKNLEKNYKKEMMELQNVLGDDFYNNIKWEDIIPDNASKSDIKNLLDELNETSKFFSRISSNEKRYGKNIAWASEMKKVSDSTTVLIKNGEDFDKVIENIAVSYKSFDERTSLETNRPTEFERRNNSGAYRGYDDPEAIGTTPFNNKKLYSEYFNRLIKNTSYRKPPYDDIKLTNIMYSKEVNPDFGNMYHPEAKYVEAGMKHVKNRYNELKPFIEKVQKGGVLTADDRKIIDDKIAEIYFLISNVLPYKRGTNGISDILMRSIYKSLNINQPALKKGVSLDLEAFCMDLNEYKNKWQTFFVK